MAYTSKETKELKKQIRDLIQPDRDLGHVDGKKKSVPRTEVFQHADVEQESLTTVKAKEVNAGPVCEDCV